ncbi:restriction endonuclease subunit S [Pectobacterium brasiliense]|uniref:restriction endonuclease subunit S n=1 Tax=Pectobacterium brasiliense TaxID=180957 RepID=UPI0019697E50|nr:restriction endonuclease subunit S [Pectobacterium brasiliense]MBN3175707.1 restriction endonuclease subunit S [Pectobacterium brasiliense]
MSSKFYSTTIGEQITLQRGFDITKKEQEEGDIPVVSSGGISSYHNVAKVSGPGVILGRKGTLGTVFFIEEDYWPHDTTLWVKDFKGNNPSFVYYFFKNMSKQLKGMDVGAANPALNRNHVHPLEIKWPRSGVQKSISKILSSLDNKIKNNDNINQTLEQMAQALFKNWFIDFEPVKAKIAVLEAGGSRTDATLAAMTAITGKEADTLAVFEREHPEQYAELKTTAELFPSAMQESEVGEIPEGWSLENYRTFCEFVQSGGTPKRSEQTYWDEGDIRWLSSGEVRDKIVFDTKEKISEVGLQNSTAKLWPKYSTVMAMYGATAGEICLLANEMSANQACCALYSEKHPFFIYFSLCNGAPVIASKASGSAQQNLNKGIIENAVFCKPTEGLMEIYNRSINGLMFMWISNVKYNKNLTQLRDTLLPKLLSGEITLPEAEQAVSEAENV